MNIQYGKQLQVSVVSGGSYANMCALVLAGGLSQPFLFWARMVHNPFRIIRPFLETLWIG